MQCRECRKWMQPYLVQTLRGKRKADFERHLDECGQCAQELAAQQEIIELLHRLPAPVPPVDLSARIKLMAEAALNPPASAARGSVSAYLKLAGACAAALLLAVGTVVLLGPPGAQRDQLSPAVAPVAAVAPREPAISQQAAVTASSAAVARRTGVSLSRPSRLKPPHRAQVVSHHAAAGGSVSAAAPPVRESPGGRSGVVAPAVRPAHPEELGPTVVSTLDKAPSIRVVQTADEQEACVPVVLAEATARTGPSRERPPARVETAGLGAADEAAGTLVGTLLANAVVNRYVREAVIESDATIMALATSAPASPSNVSLVVREAEGEEINNGW